MVESPISLAIERETLRHLAGPELFMQTAIEPMDRALLVELQGGSVIDAVKSWLDNNPTVTSAALSFGISGLASMVVTTSTSTAAGTTLSAVSSIVVSGVVSASASAVSGASATASTSGGG